MFGYSLIDLLLFNFETLVESFAGYLEEYKFVLYAGFATNLFLIYYFEKYFRWIYIILSLCWIFPGYFFFINEFSSIYWPSNYLGGFAIATGFLCIYGGINHRGTPQKNQKLLFGVFTVIPSLVTFVLNPAAVMAFGTAASIAALGTFAVSFQQKTWFGRLLSFLSLFWCFLVIVALVTLVNNA